jgi:hypothetical protein
MSTTASARGLALQRNWLPNSVQPFFVPSSRLTFGRQLKDRMNSAFIDLLTTATDIVQLGPRSGVFRDERVLIGGSRLVVFIGRWPFLFGRRKRRVVTSEPSARAFDCAAV